MSNISRAGENSDYGLSKNKSSGIKKTRLRGSNNTSSVKADGTLRTGNKRGSIQEGKDSDFKNGRKSCAINHYTPRSTSLLTDNSLIPKLEALLRNEIDAISRRERILASVPRAGRPVLYARKTRGTVFYSLRYPKRKGFSSDNAHNNPGSMQTNPGNMQTRPAILNDDAQKEIYITKSPARVLNYLNLELSEATIVQHRNNRDILQSAIEALKTQEANHQFSSQILSINKKLETLPLRGLLPEFLNWPKEKINWALAKYTTNPYYLEELRYQSKCGLWVRTKAEERIADALSEHHILFRYEPALSFDGITKYPDFVIWTRGGRIVIWEHRGAQHIESYRNNEPLLISWYEQQGFSVLSTLIITHEDDILTSHQIESIIQRFLLS